MQRGISSNSCSTVALIFVSQLAILLVIFNDVFVNVLAALVDPSSSALLREHKLNDSRWLFNLYSLFLCYLHLIVWPT